MRKKTTMHISSVICFLVCVLWSSGCNTVSSNHSIVLYETADKLEENTHELLSWIENAALENDIQRIINLPSTVLSYKNLSYAVSPGSRAAIQQALTGITNYTKILTMIASEEYRGDFSGSVVSATKSFNASSASIDDLMGFAPEAELEKMTNATNGVSAVLASVGEMIIDKSIQDKAAGIIESMDPHFYEYMHLLADIFATSSDVMDYTNKKRTDQYGLAAVIENETETRMDILNNRYFSLGIAPVDLKKKEKWLGMREEIVRTYIKEVRSKVGAIMLAITLRDACITMSETHRAMVKSNDEETMKKLTIAIGKINYMSKVFKESITAMEDEE